MDEPGVTRVLVLSRLLRSTLEENAMDVSREFLVDLDDLIEAAESQLAEAT